MMNLGVFLKQTQTRLRFAEDNIRIVSKVYNFVYSN